MYKDALLPESGAGAWPPVHYVMIMSGWLWKCEAARWGNIHLISNTSHLTHACYILQYNKIVMIHGMQCWSVLDAWVWGEKPLNQIFIIKRLDAAMQGNCGEPRLLLLLIVWPTEWLNTMATLSLPALMHSPDKSCKWTFANFEVSQSWRRSLLGPYPGWKCLLYSLNNKLIGC